LWKEGWRKEMKFTKKDIIYYVIVLVLLVAVFVLIMTLKSHQSECIKNPFVYGARNMGGVYCSCYQNNGNYKCFPRFSFTDDNITFEKREC
jgi:hypothetical protein